MGPEARQARPCNQTVSPSVKEGHDLSLMVRQICTDGASRPLRQGLSEIGMVERRLVLEPIRRWYSNIDYLEPYITQPDLSFAS
jgi:hypothetical protein